MQNRIRSRLILLTMGWIAFVGRMECGLATEPANSVTISEPEITAVDRAHWAFEPLKTSAAPAVRDANWPQNAVDRYILARLEAADLRPLPPADKPTLLRRLTFDLTGLPPTIGEQTDFLSDQAPDALERLIDRLLASPAYGTRWAQHWLDLARFAETDGFEHDLVRPNAWRFRDWVVEALNADLPYDEFVRRQIAGDILHPGDPAAAVATGWLLCGPDMPDINLKEERRHVVLNELTSSVGAVFLGLQIGCAQCHDHKFDPLSQADFYRLRACFESAEIFRDHPIPTAADLQSLEAARKNRGAASQNLDKQLALWDEQARQRLREKNPDLQPTPKELLDALTDEERKQYKEVRRQRDLLPKLPELPLGRVLREGSPQECRFCIRGDFRRPGPPMLPAFPRVLTNPGQTLEGAGLEGLRLHESLSHKPAPPRLQLAQWLTRPDNALAARVIVNRVWQFHFGEGLVRTPSDFGKMGDEPEHKLLLDWLALEFPRHEWSLKWLHKVLLMSATFQQSSRPDSSEWTAGVREQARRAWLAGKTKDPANRLWGRMIRQRLDGEAIRDALLVMSDRLNLHSSGPGIRPPLPPEMVSTLLKNQWPVTADVTEHLRRSLYLFVRRNLRYPLFEAFDRPDTNASCPRRNRSTIAPQALILLNSEFTLVAARDLCQRLLQDSPTDRETQITRCYQRALGRLPSGAEIADAKQFLSAETQRLIDSNRPVAELPIPTHLAATVPPQFAAALTEYCLAILNLNEFVYVD
ncbi:MAG: hypothetical protein JWM11_4783 [Planctomycetaceae bacterium]|nr:hypothetical protein [Planctomycetaceae bacterium]